jgi:hypothetical protein
VDLFWRSQIRNEMTSLGDFVADWFSSPIGLSSLADLILQHLVFGFTGNLFLCNPCGAFPA